MKNKLFNYFKKRLEIMEHCNHYSPFPIYDTEYVQEVKDYIKQMEEGNKKEYDEMPVIACKYCNSLHIVTDNLENDICVQCGSVNEVSVYNNIDEYLTAKEISEEDGE